VRQTLPTLQKKYFDDYFTVKRDTEDLDNETKRKSLTTERINLLVEARALYILKVMETIRADPRIRDQMARLCDYSIITDRDGKRSYKTTSSVAEIANAFGILVKMMNKVAGGTHQRATLDRYLREGRIVNLEYDINDFIIKPLAIATRLPPANSFAKVAAKSTSDMDIEDTTDATQQYGGGKYKRFNFNHTTSKRTKQTKQTKRTKQTKQTKRTKQTKQTKQTTQTKSSKPKQYTKMNNLTNSKKTKTKKFRR
jgi:hypothetical protein